MIDEVDDMTPAEQAVVDADAKRIADEAAAAAAQTEEAKAAEAARVAAEEAKTAAEEAAKAEAARAAAAQVQAPAPVLPTIQVDAALASRDFEAERTALAKAWDEGDITQAEWSAKFMAIATAEATRAAQQSLAEMTAAAAKQAAEQTFEQAANAFMARPENRDIATDPTRFAMFQGAVNAIDAATGNALPAHELLARAQAEFRKTVAAPAPAAPSAPPVRQPDLSALPPRITDAPQAGANDIGGSQQVSQFAAMAIEDLESSLATMSEDQIERILAATPGAAFELKPA
jgi:hypothetical protein